jgi:hypothetical protein
MYNIKGLVKLAFETHIDAFLHVLDYRDTLSTHIDNVVLLSQKHYRPMRQLDVNLAVERKHPVVQITAHTYEYHANTLAEELRGLKFTSLIKIELEIYCDALLLLRGVMLPGREGFVVEEPNFADSKE